MIFCERGIRTYETAYRNVLDINAVPMVQQLSHLPIVVDPSHGTGVWNLVSSGAKAGIAAGANGLMIEVHENPEEALSDGAQSLLPRKFETLMKELKVMAQVVGKEI